ncbi:MAG TPA: hypothetical protein VFY38_01575 [Pseudonocardia sp.]|nr:hypothetical protein [Pseudonocardia sp.]
MQDLAGTLGTPVRLGVLDGAAVAESEFAPGSLPPSELVRSCRLQQPRPPRSSQPAHATALGRVLLAFAAPDRVEAVLAAEGAAGEPLRAYLSCARVALVVATGSLARELATVPADARSACKS